MQEQIQNDPIINLPNLYKNGLVLTYGDATHLSLGAGNCRDSNNTIDINLGYSNVENETVSAPIILNMNVNGVNGLDTGTLTSSRMYNIFVIADSRYYQPVGCIASLSAVPLLPAGYDSYRLIGFWPTNDVTSLSQGYYSAQGNNLTFNYDSQQIVLTAGTSNITAVVDVSAVVPSGISQVIVGTLSYYTGGTLGNALNLYNHNNTNTNYVVYFCDVVSQIQSNVSYLMSGYVGSSPAVVYKVGSGDSVTLYVLSFQVTV
jgi:hypothetical protein